MTDNTAYEIPEVKDCMGYETLGSIEIRLGDLDSFIEYTNKCKPETIWSCYAPICNKFKTADGKSPDFEREKPHSEIFFFTAENVIYSAESDGYRLLYDYIYAKEMGFLDYRSDSLLRYISEKYKVESVASLYYDAVSHGYKDFEEFNNSYRFYDEFEQASRYRAESYLSRELGFKKYADWQMAKLKGFEKGAEYYEAASLGIDNPCEFQDYRILFIKRFDYDFETPFEFHIFHIISRLRGGQSIKLKEMERKLRRESHNYSRDWYGQDRHEITVELLKYFLSSNSKFSKIGKLISVSEDVEFSLYRNDTIYVDGSNVAWNNGSRERGDVPHARNIKAVINKLGEIGFNRVLVLCDNNLYDEVDDNDVYKELSRTGYLQAVAKGNVADEWLLRFKEDKDRFIITNDKYTEYRENYPDIKTQRVSFQVIGNEARFEDKIYKVVDGILPRNELPRLCHQFEGKEPAHTP